MNIYTVVLEFTLDDKIYAFSILSVIHVAQKDHSQEDPWPRWCKILKNSKPDVLGIKAVENLPNEDKKQRVWWLFSFQKVRKKFL